MSFVRLAEFGSDAPETQKFERKKLLPKSHAWFEVTSSNGMGSEDMSLCKVADKLEVTMPGNAHPMRTIAKFGSCASPAGISFLLPGLPN